MVKKFTYYDENLKKNINQKQKILLTKKKKISIFVHVLQSKIYLLFLENLLVFEKFTFYLCF